MAGIYEAIVSAVLALMVFGVFGFITWTTAVLALRVRRLPGEMLQLRLFQSHRRLALSLILIGAGVATSFLHVMPYMVGITPPVEFHNGVIVATTALFVVGFVWLARVFWLPTKRAESNE